MGGNEAPKEKTQRKRVGGAVVDGGVVGAKGAAVVADEESLRALVPPKRIGFMPGAYESPADFDTMAADGIRVVFEGG